MSNPLRQSLYTLDDCLNGGEFKVKAAVKSLKQIFPAVEVEGVVMAVPMPGHPISNREEKSDVGDCSRLRDLIDSHDVIFLLTDTRESGWLPTLLSSSANKIAITAALGLDSFLVMRHGVGPFSSTHGFKDEAASADISGISLIDKDGGRRLGCYFCNDVLVGIAVELLVGILHHPLGTSAEGNFANSNNIESDDHPLGILPHRIRGSLSQFSQMTLLGHSSNSCTACSSTVVSEYQKRRMEFILEAINHPTYLEDITGLT